MNDEQTKKARRFWPMIFLTAFAVGGVLWVLWMAKVIQQTRDNRVNGFFVPMATNAPPADPFMATNRPALPANSTTNTN